MDAQLQEIQRASAYSSSVPGDAKQTNAGNHRASGTAVERPDEQSAASVDRETVQKVLEDTQQHLHERGVDLKFRIDQDSGDIQVELVNKENEKIVRKIPADEVLKLSNSLKEMAGAFLNRSV